MTCALVFTPLSGEYPAVGEFSSQEVAALFRQYGPPVYRRALRLLRDEADAEEALQDVFMKALRHGDHFEERGKTLNWLYRITTNHCLNVIRGRKRRRALKDAYEGTPQRASASHQVDMTTLQQLLREADSRQAEAAVYVHIDGMSYSEAAVLLGVSKRTVGNLIERFNTWAAKRLEAA